MGKAKYIRVEDMSAKHRIQAKEKLIHDMINNPPHYTKWGIEPIDYTISNELNFCEWNIIKYITRYKHKNGLEDLKKCQFYINKLIEGWNESQK